MNDPPTPGVAAPPSVVDVASTAIRTEPPVLRYPRLPFTDAVASVTRLGLGAVGIAVSTFTSMGRRTGENGNAAAPATVGPRQDGGIMRLLPGALLGAGFEAERRLLNASAAVEVRVIHLSAAVSRRVPGAPRSAFERSLVRWNERGRAEQARNEVLMGEFIRRLAPELAAAMVELLPVDEIVARMDMPALTRQLLESVDLAGIVRESTATVGGEVVDSARSQAKSADSLVERAIDRMLFRRTPRDLDLGIEGV
jgi:hypothetical protein